jgi:hypothetical protein
LVGEFSVCASPDPASVNDLKGLPSAAAHRDDAVPRHAGHIVDNGDLLADQPIK